eukprot:29580-Pelagococcus_subviridis.AAC.5
MSGWSSKASDGVERDQCIERTGSRERGRFSLPSGRAGDAESRLGTWTRRGRTRCWIDAKTRRARLSSTSFVVRPRGFLLARVPAQVDLLALPSTARLGVRALGRGVPQVCLEPPGPSVLRDAAEFAASPRGDHPRGLVRPRRRRERALRLRLELRLRLRLRGWILIRTTETT